MSEHTPEPWRVGRPGTVVSDTPVPGMGGSDAVEYYGGHLIGESIIEENARRIVACVNACAGMGDPTAEIAELKRQRDELLAALEEAVKYLEPRVSGGRVGVSLVPRLKSAITKAKGAS